MALGEQDDRSVSQQANDNGGLRIEPTGILSEGQPNASRMFGFYLVAGAALTLLAVIVIWALSAIW